MALALVMRMPTLVEAQIATGALRSAGIAAEVFDSNFGQIEAPVIEALGGFRIMAPDDEVVAARDIIRTLRGGPGLGEPGEYPEDTPKVARTWPGWLVTAIPLAAAVVAIMGLLQRH